MPTPTRPGLLAILQDSRDRPNPPSFAVIFGAVRLHFQYMFHTPMTLTVNGEPRDFPNVRTCADLIAVLGFAGKRVALECNGEIVPRGRHAEHVLADGDKVEIVVAVGGG